MSILAECKTNVETKLLGLLEHSRKYLPNPAGQRAIFKPTKEQLEQTLNQMRQFLQGFVPEGCSDAKKFEDTTNNMFDALFSKLEECFLNSKKISSSSDLQQLQHQ